MVLLAFNWSEEKVEYLLLEEMIWTKLSILWPLKDLLIFFFINDVLYLLERSLTETACRLM